MLSSEGQLHREQRKLLNPHFAFAKVKSFVGVIHGQTQRLIAKLIHLAATKQNTDIHSSK